MATKQAMQGAWKLACDVEIVALAGALQSPDVDKTDFIRIWALARTFMGDSCGSEDWDKAYNATCPPDLKERIMTDGRRILLEGV